jgi:hypothetical protein
MIELIILVALLIASNAYWAFVCLKLTNRVMSKNYGELIQATAKPVKLAPMKEDMSDPVAESHADTMNSMLGAISS